MLCDELFVTTKIWIDKFAKGQMCTRLRESLSKLQMEQVDVTLIHWSFADVSIPASESTGDLLKVKRQRLKRLISVSNYNAAHM